MKVLECEVGFYDAGGFDPGSEDVLLSGLVVSGSNPIQAVQVAGDDKVQESMDLGSACLLPLESSVSHSFFFTRLTVGPVSECEVNQERT